MHLWKRKLAAYLHDPPSKCLGTSTQGDRSIEAFRQAGFVEEEVDQYFADQTAISADRLPFPQSRIANLTCVFDGVTNTFLHPLSGGKYAFHTEFKSVGQDIEGEGDIQPALSEVSLANLRDDDERWRARFFAHWRLWPKRAAEKDYRMGLIPADPRIPDHSTWSHMQVVSGLAGCVDEQNVLNPAFLKFQLGPVQDFIAAARSIRDLWSGSYLLSWLMAAGMKALSARVGPDSVIFPNLRGQPIFDLHWRGELWSKLKIGDKTVWDSLKCDERDELTPNLPNVFLAMVPAAMAKELAHHVCEEIRAEWSRIAETVWKECDRAGLVENEGGFSTGQRKQRFDGQVNRFLSLSWQVTPWPESLDGALKLADDFATDTPVAIARQRVQAVVEVAEKHMPAEHRDGLFYHGGPNGPKEKLNNIGLGWSVIVARNSWELDAVRQTRAFGATNTGGWEVGTFSNKDALTGREEAVAGGEVWFGKCLELGQFWPGRFKKSFWLGAPTLIKRLWDIAYLNPVWGIAVQKFPNTRGISAHDPFASDEQLNDEDRSPEIEKQPLSEKYFAVLALDGDEIGKWVSGERTPRFCSQLANYPYAGAVGALDYFKRFAGFLNLRRPLSPSYHLQFSEALSNFALLCARPIVEAFDGRLIYAGGDDVVALLPADTAIECGQALRLAFKGSVRLKEVLHTASQRLRSRHIRQQGKDPTSVPTAYYQNLAAEDCLLDEGSGVGFLHRLDLVDAQDRPIPFVVPGPDADCSIGIAIGHFKAPLQDLVRAAQAAERRAKRKVESGGLGRNAVALSLFKRSGEIIEWGAKWEGGLELYQALASALGRDELSSRFPHRLIELLGAYLSGTTPLLRDKLSVQSTINLPVDEVIKQEFEHCLLRQRGPRFPNTKNDADIVLSKLRAALNTYLQSITFTGISEKEVEKRLQALIGLCQSVAFAHRTSDDAADTDESPKPAEKQTA